jgi:hypothetical protein
MEYITIARNALGIYRMSIYIVAQNSIRVLINQWQRKGLILTMVRTQICLEFGHIILFLESSIANAVFGARGGC